MTREKLIKFWDYYGTVCILLVIVVLFGALSPTYFLQSDNIVQIFVQSSITILTALGEFFAILIAGIDLSIGSIVALAGILTAKLMVAGMDPLLSVLIGGVLVGIVLGAFNGMLVNYTGLHPFIITLGTNAIFRGVTMIISGANPVFGLPFSFIDGLGGNIWIFPAPVVLALSMAVILWFITTNTRVGRNIYALGGNRESAYFSGVDIKLHTLIVFMISGLCAGLAGVLTTARLGAAEPTAGISFETYAIASAIIGGTSFFGGKGRIPSVVVGGLIIGTISNGLNLLKIQTFYQLVVMGSLIIAAVALDRMIARAR
ncbi:MAG: D-allose ABC transporter permease [Azospirillaceae bacterium]|nr:D-allose ABC transporter permease [Azospirillaceae bacterium]